MEEKGNKANFKRNRSKNKFDTKKKFGDTRKRQNAEKEKIQSLQKAYANIDSTKFATFEDFPLSEKTLNGLKALRFTAPTKIQRQSIGLSLQGHDILGAAKTGSGKTLAFIIPVLEHLYCQKWGADDGLGALIISPTRELAYQIFEVLRKVGRFHDFSAGLVIGGKFVREEAERINRTNIVICTPGRLLQHMDETAYFHADNLKILVLDEADRILDLGFQQTMNGIIQNLPPDRQTLLFSATQTKSVKDLARLSLKDPMYVSVHENAQHSTPTQLEQSYLVCELEDKIGLIWSFIKHHLKSKILVFMASCKQVRFIYESFRRIRPGVPVMALHGSMPQMKRMAVYDAYIWKQHAVLFATDIAARGLDFPAVNWVVQLDCPEDAKTYIHRVGRTARHETNGEALLVLLPTEEEALVAQLQEKKIPINKIKVNPKKQRTVQGKIESLLAADVQLKEFAQRAFVSYLKSVFFMSNKEVFDVTKLNTEAYASSLGLAVTPRVRFIEKKIRENQSIKPAAKLKTTKSKPTPKIIMEDNSTNQGAGSSSEDGESSEYESSDEAGSSGDESENSSASDTSDDSENDRTGRLRANPEDAGGFHLEHEEDDDDDDDLLKVKRSSEEIFPVEEEVVEEINQEVKAKKIKPKTKYAAAKKILKKKLQVNTKVTFNDEGEEDIDAHRQQQVAAAEDDYVGGIDILKARLRLAEEDKLDKKLYQQKVKVKHREKKIKEKEKKRKERFKGNEGDDDGDDDDDDDEDVQVILGDPDAPPPLEEGSRSGDDSDEGWNSADYSDYGEEDSPPHKRQKHLRRGDTSEEQEESDSEHDDAPVAMETGLSLADDESLALRLLQSS